MLFFSALLFALSASLDAFIVGISLGIRRVPVSTVQNLAVSLITLAGTVFSIFLGKWLAPFMDAQKAALFGSGILICMGSYYLLKNVWISLRRLLRLRKYAQTRRPKQTCAAHPAHSAPVQTGQEAKDYLTDLPRGSILSPAALLLLGLSLSINNVGIGIGASIAGIALLPASVLTFCTSVCLLWLGNHLGKTKLQRYTDRFADPLSGLLLIGLGIYELL